MWPIAHREGREIQQTHIISISITMQNESSHRAFSNGTMHVKLFKEVLKIKNPEFQENMLPK
jgi:hypothetical protein